MKLKTLLENSKGINIKVGANSSFVYCDVCDENVGEKLEKIGNYYLTLFKERVEKLQAKKSLKEDEKQEYETIKNFVENYIPLLDREVIYCVNGISKDEPNTKVVKVNGLETGRFWTIKEFKSKKNKLLAQLG